MRLFEFQQPEAEVATLRRPFDFDHFLIWADALLHKGYKYLAFDGDSFIFSPQPILPEQRRNGPVSLVRDRDKAARLFTELPRHRVSQFGWGAMNDSKI